MLYIPVPPPTEPSLDVGCSTNDECPDYTACENRQCINPCAYKNPCAPTAHCRVVRHSPICTCPDGYVGSPTTSCQLRKDFIHHGKFLNCVGLSFLSDCLYQLCHIQVLIKLLFSQRSSNENWKMVCENGK